MSVAKRERSKVSMLTGSSSNMWVYFACNFYLASGIGTKIPLTSHMIEVTVR